MMESRGLAVSCKNSCTRSLEEWVIKNQPDVNHSYKDEFWKQVKFLFNTLIPTICGATRLDSEYENARIRVVGRHYFEGIKLPICEIELLKYRTKVLLKGNFANWKVGVNTDLPITCTFMEKVSKKAEQTFFFGITQDLITEDYKVRENSFTVELTGDYTTHLFVLMLRDFIEN